MGKKILALAFGLLTVTGYAADKGTKKGKATAVSTTSSFAEQRLRNMYFQMELTKSGLAFDVFEKALMGYANLNARQLISDKQILTIIDFGKPSKEKRLWVLDMKNRKVVYHTLVAHGRNTGDDIAKRFSNLAESHMSSLGFYSTSTTYQGKHGYSLRLDGLEADYNSNALKRAVVIHGADYVSEDFIKKHGRLGRSHGCPALPVGLNKEIIDTIKGKTCLYIHAPEAKYKSDLLDAGEAFEQMIKAKME